MHSNIKQSIQNQISLLIGLIVITIMSVVTIYDRITPSIINSSNSLVPTPYIFSQTKLWQIINNWQIKQGWEPYIEDEYLCNLAEKRLEEIKTDWSHEGFSKYFGTFRYFRLGENLARDYLTEEETFNAWLNSPTHRKNLTEYYTYSCLRCETNKCVQLFVDY